MDQAQGFLMTLESNKDCQTQVPLLSSYLALGDKEMAMGDFGRAIKLKPDSTLLILELSKLHLGLGELSESLDKVKECLRQDPDQKACKAHFRAVKKLDKAMKKVEQDYNKKLWRNVIQQLFDDQVFDEISQVGASSLVAPLEIMACQSFAKVNQLT